MRAPTPPGATRRVYVDRHFQRKTNELGQKLIGGTVAEPAAEEKLLDRFRDPAAPLKFVIMTSKLPTGFDAPILQVIYLDKPMKDHNLLQAISRLNRTTAGKEETFVLDFENTAEDIEKGFQPFYDRVTLSKETDANQLYNIRTDLDKFTIHEAADLEAFAKEWFGAKRRVEKLQGVVNPVVHLASVEQAFLSASSSSNKRGGCKDEGYAARHLVFRQQSAHSSMGVTKPTPAKFL